MSFSIHSIHGVLGVEIWIPNNKKLYARLFEHKELIEHELAEKANWMPLPDRIASRIKISFPATFEDESNWESYFDRLLEIGEKIKTVFPKYW